MRLLLPTCTGHAPTPAPSMKSVIGYFKAFLATIPRICTDGVWSGVYREMYAISDMKYNAVISACDGNNNNTHTAKAQGKFTKNIFHRILV